MKFMPSDSMHGGVWTLQHYYYKGNGYDLRNRVCMLGARILHRFTARDRGPLIHGQYVQDQDAFGDIIGWLAWYPQDRILAGWMNAWPAIITPKIGIPRGTNPGMLTMLPIKSSSWGGDSEFRLLTMDDPPQLPRSPIGTLGLVLPGTEQDHQEELWYRTDPRLIVPYREDWDEYSELVTEAKKHSQDVVPEIDRVHEGRLNHHLVIGGSADDSWAPAWLLGVPGEGLCVGDPDGANQVTTPGKIYANAFASYTQQGPLHVGHYDDRHQIGKDADGQPINPLHIWTEALFYQDKAKDGPLAFTDLPWKNGGSQIPSRVYLSWDDQRQVWDWWTRVPIVPPPTTPPDRPPPDQPPPPPGTPFPPVDPPPPPWGPVAGHTSVYTDDGWVLNAEPETIEPSEHEYLRRRTVVRPINPRPARIQSEFAVGGALRVESIDSTGDYDGRLGGLFPGEVRLRERVGASFQAIGVDAIVNEQQLGYDTPSVVCAVISNGTWQPDEDTTPPDDFFLQIPSSASNNNPRLAIGGEFSGAELVSCPQLYNDGDDLVVHFADANGSSRVGAVTPSSDDGADLGTAALSWRNVYCSKLYADSVDPDHVEIVPHPNFEAAVECVEKPPSREHTVWYKEGSGLMIGDERVLVATKLPDPDDFDDWKDWARAVKGVLE